MELNCLPKCEGAMLDSEPVRAVGREVRRDDEVDNLVRVYLFLKKKENKKRKTTSKIDKQWKTYSTVRRIRISNKDTLQISSSLQLMGVSKIGRQLKPWDDGNDIWNKYMKWCFSPSYMWQSLATAKQAIKISDNYKATITFITKTKHKQQQQQ